MVLRPKLYTVGELSRENLLRAQERTTAVQERGQAETISTGRESTCKERGPVQYGGEGVLGHSVGQLLALLPPGMQIHPLLETISAAVSPPYEEYQCPDHLLVSGSTVF